MVCVVVSGVLVHQSFGIFEHTFGSRKDPIGTRKDPIFLFIRPRECMLEGLSGRTGSSNRKSRLSRPRQARRGAMPSCWRAGRPIGNLQAECFDLAGNNGILRINALIGPNRFGKHLEAAAADEWNSFYVSSVMKWRP